MLARGDVSSCVSGGDKVVLEGVLIVVVIKL